MAEKAGYVSLADAVREGCALSAGDKVWAHSHGKALILVQLGSKPLSEGMNILGAHIDSPRLDLKQNPLYESNGFALLDTHYYGASRTTNGLRSRSPCTASSPRRTARSWT